MFNILRNYLKFCFCLIYCCVYIKIFFYIIIMFMSYNLFDYNFFIKLLFIVNYVKFFFVFFIFYCRVFNIKN